MVFVLIGFLNKLIVIVSGMQSGIFRILYGFLFLMSLGFLLCFVFVNSVSESFVAFLKNIHCCVSMLALQA